MSRELENKSQTERKFLQTRHLMKNYDPKCTRNSENSIIRKQRSQLKGGQKTLRDTLPKKIPRWKVSIWKDTLQHISSGKCKLKQRDTTIHLLGWPKSTTLTTPNAGGDVEQQKSSFTPGGSNRNPHSLLLSLWKTVGRFLTKVNITIQSGNHSPWYLPKEIESCVHPKTCTQVFIAAF